jgi:hypothetical protein
MCMYVYVCVYVGQGLWVCRVCTWFSSRQSTSPSARRIRRMICDYASWRAMMGRAMGSTRGRVGAQWRERCAGLLQSVRSRDDSSVRASRSQDRSELMPSPQGLWNPGIAQNAPGNLATFWSLPERPSLGCFEKSLRLSSEERLVELAGSGAAHNCNCHSGSRSLSVLKRLTECSC